MFEAKKILLPLELEDDEKPLLRKTLEMAKQFGSTLLLLYVNDAQRGYREPLSHEDEVALKVREWVEDWDLHQVELEYLIAQGDVGDAVNKAVDEKNVDLVVTGHRHQNGLLAKITDSQDEDIVNSVRVPVLVFPK